jgi:hypothetical protein
MRQPRRARLHRLIPVIVLAAVSLTVPVTAQQGATAKTPDFTGVWTTYNAGGAGRLGIGGGGGGAAGAPAPAAGRAAGDGRAAGAGRPGGPGAGGRGGGAAQFMTDVAKQKVAAYRALVSPRSETPGGYCLGTGMPGSMLGSGGYPMEIHQRPEQIMIVYEAHAEIRRVYLGKRIQPEEDRVPGRNGYSVGRWEGDTLVVETTHLVEQVDQQYAHSDQAKIVERYRLIDGPNGSKVLEAQMTMTDPVFYTQPVTAEKRWSMVPDGHLLPYECAEENWNKRLEELERNASKK